MMETTAGFYSVTPEGELLHAPNTVHGPGFDLFKEDRDSYTYPVNGWTWYESIELARMANGIPEPEPEPEIDPTIIYPLPQEY